MYFAAWLVVLPQIFSPFFCDRSSKKRSKNQCFEDTIKSDKQNHKHRVQETSEKQLLHYNIEKIFTSYISDSVYDNSARPVKLFPAIFLCHGLLSNAMPQSLHFSCS